MITIQCPSAQLLQFSLPSANAATMPFFLPTDLAFQLLLTAETVEEADAFEADASIKLLLMQTGTVNNNDEVDTRTIYDYDSAVEINVYRISATQLLLYCNDEIPDVATHLEGCGKCFRLGVRILFDSVTYTVVSSLLKMLCNEKYTSVFEYACDENSFGFIYCGGLTPNRGRLPIYFSKPQYPDERAMYVKSNGAIKLTKAVAKKEYDAITDYMDEAVHEKVQLLLNHDTISIESFAYTGGFVKNSAYAIDYPDRPGYSREGMAKFKALVSPYNSKNSNCQVCTPYVPPEPPECIVVVGPAVDLPDAVIGEAYNVEIELVGTSPFVLSEVVKPDWMSIVIVGSEIQITGTPEPGDEAESVPVAFAITNCGGSAGMGVYINVA